MAKFQQIEQAVTSLDKQVKLLTTDLQKLVTSVNSNSKSQTELANKTDKVKKATVRISAVEKERIKVQNQIKSTFTKSLTLQEKGTKTLLKGKIRLREQQKKLNAEIKEELGLNKKRVSFTSKLVGAWAAVTGAVMAARGATKLVNNVIKSTQASGDAWAISLGGMKASYDAFNKSLASGDLKNVFKNMKEAFKAGKDYVAVMDDLGDRERALAVLRAESKVQIENLTNTVQNVTLAEKERIDAAQQIFDIEKNLLTKSQSVRTQDYEAQVDIVSKLTGMREDEVLAFIKNYDEEKALRESAIKLIELESKVKEARSISDVDALQKSTNAVNAYKLTLSDVEKAYIETYTGYSKTTDEELDKVVASYVALQEAESSSVAGMRRISNQYNTLIQGIGNADNQVAQKRITTAQTLADNLIKIEEDVISKKIALDEEEFNASVASDIEANDEELERLFTQIDKEFEIKKAAADREIELAKKVADEEEELRLEKLDKTAQGLDFIGNATQELFSLQNSLAESEIDNLTRQKEAEVAAAEAAGLDTSKIEEKYAKKESTLRNKQAKKEKEQALFTAALNTASAIVAAAAIGPPQNIAAIAFATALGAVQIAAIAAEPIPKFKHGTNGQLQLDTTAIVGDGGERELISTPQGNFLSPATDTMVHLPRGSQVFSGADTKEMLHGNEGNIIGLEPLIKEQQLTRKAISNINQAPTIDARGIKHINKSTRAKTTKISTWLQ